MAYFLSLFHFSLKYFLHYRGSSIFYVVSQILLQIGVYLSSSVYFDFEPNFAGLNKDQFIFFVASFHLISALYLIFVEPSHDVFPDMVFDGDLDFILIRPFNAFILSHFSRIGIESFIILLPPLFIILTSFAVWQNATWLNVGFYFLFLLNGFLVYSLLMSIAVIFCFWSAQNVALWKSAETLLETGSRPIRAYPKSFQLIFGQLFPIALVINLPTDVLVFGANWYNILIALCLTLFLIFLVRILWKKGLLSYASAG